VRDALTELVKNEIPELTPKPGLTKLAQFGYQGPKDMATKADHYLYGDKV
jgi:hypothetical protein